jgi:hypothetical protein
MILHKTMIAGAIEIARVEKDNPGLSCVLFDTDGSVVACNAWAIYAAQPSVSKITSTLPFLSNKKFETPCAVNITQLINLIKAIPADKLYKSFLEHVSMVQDGQFIDCEYNDGRAVVKQRLRCSKVLPVLANWRSRLSDLTKNETAGGMDSFVYNRSRLVSVVNAIEAACKYNGEFAFISKQRFSNGEVWRSVNELLGGQTVIIAHILPSAAQTPERSDWDKSIFKRKITLSCKLKK